MTGPILECKTALRARPPLRKGIDGFSLAELMVVMALIALMSSIAIPALSGQRGASLTSAGNTVVDMVALARQTALSENSLVLVVIGAKQANLQQSIKMMEYDTLGNIWKSASGAQRLPIETKVTDKGSDNVTSGVAQQFGMTVTNGDVALLFYPDGHLENGSSTTLRALRATMASETNSSPANFYDVVINPSTSAFQVSRN